MSQYRSIKRLPLNDVYQVEPIYKRGTSTRLPVHTPAAAEGASQGQRKADPASSVLKTTLEWAESLPQEVRPYEVLHSFPRVANHLCLTWTDASAFQAYMDELHIDRRGNREGFPVAVIQELDALRAYHDKLHQS